MSDTNDRPVNEESKPPRRKSRGWWWKIPLILLVLLVLLILLLPTLASTAPVRSMVLSKVNASLPGKLGVGDWSLGWFSGVHAKNVEWTDAQGKRVATINEVQTPITLMQVVRGDYHFGEIVIPNADVDLVIPAGEVKPAQREPETNRQTGQLGGQTPPTVEASKPINLPDVSGTIRIQSVTGQVTFVGSNSRTAAIKLDKSTSLTAVLPPGGGQAKCDVMVGLQQPAGPGSAVVNAVVNGIKPGALDPATLTGNATVKLQGLDLDQAAAIARVYGTDMALKGLLSGQVDAASAAPGQFDAKGQLGADGVSMALGKDQIQSRKLQIPVDATYNAANQRANIRQLAVLLDQGQVSVVGDLSLQSLKDLQAGRPVTDEGSFHVLADFPNLPTIFNALRNTLKLQQDVQITAGKFSARVDGDISREGLKVHAPIALTDFAGTRNGQKIGPLQPISIDAAALMPSLKDVMATRDVNVNVSSSFLNLTAKGPTLPRSVVNGQADVAKLRADFGQLVDLSMFQSGRATFSVVNRSQDANTLEPDAQVQVTNLGLNLPASQGQPPRRLDNGTLLVSGRARYANDVVELMQPARVELAGRLVEMPQGQPERVIFDTPMQVVANGSANLQANARTLHLTQLVATVGGNAPILQLAKAGEAPVDLQLAGKRGVTGKVPMTLQTDLVAAMGLAQRASAATQPTVKNLKSGIFRSTVIADIAADGRVSVSLPDSVTDLTLVSGRQQIADRVNLKADAAIPADNSSVQVAANAKGSAFELAVPQTTVVLSRDGAPVSTLEMVPATKVNLTVSDLGKATAEANAFSPAVPLLTGDPVTLNLTTSREKNTLAFNVDANSGQIRYAEKPNAAPLQPIKLAVQGQVVTDPAQKELMQQMRELRVSQLEGQLPFAQVSLPQPIVITDLPAVMAALKGGNLPENAKVEGQVRVTSTLEKLASLSGKPATGGYSFAGAVTSDQKIALQGRDILVQLSTVISDFKVMQGDKAIVQEPKLTVGGGVRLATQQKLLTLDNIGVKSAEGLLDLAVNGGVSDLGTQNRFEKLQVKLTPDLGKVWPIIYATLTPEQQTKIGELDVSGKRASTINVGGSFPTNVPYAQAIKQVTLTGDFGFEKIDYKKYGITSDAPGVIPFTLEGGKLLTAYKTEQGYTPAEPLKFNGGLLDVSQATIDLAGDAPRLSMPANKAVVQKIHLNQVMIASLGKYANPMLIDPRAATGQADVSVVRCDGMPLGQAMYNPADPGYAEFSVSVTNLDMASKGADLLMAALRIEPVQGQDTVAINIKDARVVIANGRCTQKANVQLGQYALGFNGAMTLQDSVFSKLTVDVPNTLVANRLGDKNLVKYIPDRVGLNFSGPANALKLDESTFTQLAASAVQKQAVGVLGNAIGGQGANQAQGQGQQTPAGAIGGIVGGLLGGQQQQQTAPQQAAPNQQATPQQQPAAPAQPGARRRARQAASQPAQSAAPAPQQNTAPASPQADPVDTLIDIFAKPKKK